MHKCSMHRCSPVLRLHDHACHQSTLRDISDSLSVRRSTTSSSIASGLHAHNWSRSVDRCKIKCAAPRRWLETVLRGTPCDTASSSAKLGSPVKYRFQTPILSGSPVWIRFELTRLSWPSDRTRGSPSFSDRFEHTADACPAWAPSLDTSRTRCFPGPLA